MEVLQSCKIQTKERSILMQVNSVNNLGTTSFGNNVNKCKKDCPQCSPKAQTPMITIPRVVYAALLAAVMGGPLTGCQPFNPPEDPIETTYNPKTPTSPNTYIGGVDSTGVVAETKSVSDKLSDMVDYLRVDVKTASTIGASEVVKQGDVIEFGYHDDYMNTDEKLSINQELSTKDALVFDGTSKDLESGQVSYIRHTITSTDDGTVVKKQVTKLGKPPSENSGWNNLGTFKYVTAPDGIKEYTVGPDGSEYYQGKYVPKNETTVSKVFENGESFDLTNVSVTELKRLGTGLNDVHM